MRVQPIVGCPNDQFRSCTARPPGRRAAGSPWKADHHAAAHLGQTNCFITCHAIARLFQRDFQPARNFNIRDAHVGIERLFSACNRARPHLVGIVKYIKPATRTVRSTPDETDSTRMSCFCPRRSDRAGRRFRAPDVNEMSSTAVRPRKRLVKLETSIIRCVNRKQLAPV